MATTDTNAEIVQGSPEWRALRLGKITCSRFKDVLTLPKTKAAKLRGEMSQTAKSYLLELVAEILTGEDQGPPPTWAMERGTAMEPLARDLYTEVTGDDVKEVGFIEHPDEPMIGGSPDGLVGDDGGLEIKCPGNTRVHLEYMLAGVLPKEHVPQVQGLLWISKRKWWEFVSYDPRIIGSESFRLTDAQSLRLAMWRHRVERDEAYIEQLEKAVFVFKDTLLVTLCNLKTGGNFTV